MLQAEAGHVIAERQQKMIAAIMPRAEQRAGFLYQILIMLDQFVAQLDRAVAIAGQMQIMVLSRACPARWSGNARPPKPANRPEWSASDG